MCAIGDSLPRQHLTRDCASGIAAISGTSIASKQSPLGERMRATEEGNAVSKQLFEPVRKFGNRCFDLATVDRMVRRGNSFSRVGLNALGLLYDSFYELTAQLGLVAHFDNIDPRVAYFCAWKES
jgi:hypothetical protein